MLAVPEPVKRPRQTEGRRSSHQRKHVRGEKLPRATGHRMERPPPESALAQPRTIGSQTLEVRGLEELVAVGEMGRDEDEPRVRPVRPTAPGLTELGDRLSDRLDTRVKVTLGRSKGKIAIEFASLTDLERIVNVIDPRNRDDRPI